MNRRLFCAGIALITAGCDPFALPEPPQPLLTEEDKALKKKFKGMRGGELRVDAFGEKECVSILNEDGLYFYGKGMLSARNNSVHSYGARFGVPKTLRVSWRTGECRPISNGSYEGGTILGDYTVPVASRIPETLLTEMRRNKYVGFRLKIRIHDDGPLIGWDLATMVDRIHVGGDFEEAHLVYEGDRNNPTKRWVKGWCIHPKTGQKIETDF